MANRYAVGYPRNFANEYAVYSGTDHDLAAIESEYDHDENGRFERIDRPEAIRLGERRPKEAKRDGEQWFGGWYADSLSPSTWSRAERMVECREATARYAESLRVMAAGESAWGEPS
jgi:hypothetical protein